MREQTERQTVQRDMAYSGPKTYCFWGLYTGGGIRSHCDRKRKWSTNVAMRLLSTRLIRCRYWCGADDEFILDRDEICEIINFLARY